MVVINTFSEIMIRFYAICAVLVILSSCNSSNGLSKKGEQLAATGNYELASDFYCSALEKNQRNVNALIGLKASSRQVMDKQLQDFFIARQSENHREAVYNYLKAEAYREKVNRFGADLQIPAFYKQDFEASKTEYLKSQYDKGKILLSNDSFDQAQEIFNEINKLDPNFKDIKNLLAISVFEPKYKQAKQSMNAGSYRKAYYLFDEIYQSNPGFSDVQQLREWCLNEGVFIIGLAKEDQTNYSKAQNSIYSYLLTELTQLNNPFLKIVDRENMDKVLKEKEQSLSGVFSNSSANTGQVLGTDAILIGEVIEQTNRTNPVKSYTKSAFEQYRIEKINKETNQKYYETNYRKVNYTEYYGMNETTIQYRFKLTSLKDGSIILTAVETNSESDQAHYANYSGNYKFLYPIRNQNDVNLTPRDKQNLHSLFNAYKELKPLATLQNSSYQNIAHSIALKIDEVIKSLD